MVETLKETSANTATEKVITKKITPTEKVSIKTAETKTTKLKKTDEVKTENKKDETKAEGKKIESKKNEVKKVESKKVETKKYIPFEVKIKVKKSKEAKELQEKLKTKKKHPTFRGRFGKKCIRKKSIEKWNKWRHPNGIDMKKEKKYGARPKTGYANPAWMKGVHPSGYREIVVNNISDLQKVNVNTEAARIGACVGKRKWNTIVKKAGEMKIHVLN